MSEPDEDPFEDEGYDTSISRLKTGVKGLDAMIRGGIPARFLVSIIGPPGTGKTMFGLEFVRAALEDGDKALFITLEQSDDEILEVIDELTWNFDYYFQNNQLSILDLDPMEIIQNLETVRQDLPRIVNNFGASRLVLDSISVLEMMYDEQSKRRTDIFDFADSLKNAGVTTLLTSESDFEHSYRSRYGIIEYLTDAVIIMRYIRPEDFRETRLALEINKIRNTLHSREMKPYEITDRGISVYRQANIL